MTKIRNQKLKYFIVSTLSVLGIFLVANFALAQIDVGLGFGEGIGLGTQDIRVTIANIIRIALGVLGIIAVVAIIAGGVVYMTAGGDGKRVDIAKKIMINSAIGLAIILTSFAITQFVLNQLLEATGARPGEVTGPPGGGPGGGLGPIAFTLRGITPQGDILIRNVTVRATFNSAVNGATVPGNFTVTRVSDGAVVEGMITTARNTVEFTPVANCPAPNEDRKCFDADTEYRVNLTTDIRSTSGQSLVCGGFALSCEGFFTTGSLIDVSGPVVVMTVPDVGESVSIDSLVSLEAFATDDAGISQIEFYVDGAFQDADAPSGPSPREFLGAGIWDTAGVVLGSHSINARAYDVDTNETISSAVNVYVRAAHCFNGLRDADEEGIDCGGLDCGSCEGGACESDGDCASGVCRDGVCVSTPRIDGVLPGDGSEGNYITILGEFFGNSVGNVVFLGADGSGDDRTAPLADCASAWQENQVIIEVPSGATDGPIQLTASSGEFDTTNNERGALISDFVVNDVLRPGICETRPLSGVPGDAIEIIGAQFGASIGSNQALLGGRSILPTSWGNELISGVVPNVSVGRRATQVIVGAEASNPVYFRVVSSDAGTLPFISYIDPSSGPREGYITIYGENFGSGVGTVVFRRGEDEATALVNFPSACSSDFWHNNSITVKIPLEYTGGIDILNGEHLVFVRRADGVESAALNFNIEDGVAGPGICRINPDNGPSMTPVTVSGERFGRTAGNLRFWENQTALINSWGDQQILATVPAGATTGPVSATVGVNQSNSVNFRISNCNEAGCGLGEECCANGVCISEEDECLDGPRAGGFAWRFSTGVIPTVPRAVEECREGVSPSPSPWDRRRGGDNVCVNAAINVRFTTEMDASTLNLTNINVYQCIGAGDNPCAEVALVGGRIDAYADGFQFLPAGGLSPSARYYVNLKTGLRGAGVYGDFMQEDAARCGLGNAYCFTFGTRADDEPCAVGSVAVNPSGTTITALGGIKDYLASAISRSDICIALNSDAYNWGWSVAESNGASTLDATITNRDEVGGGDDGLRPDGNVDASQIATANNETVPDPPVRVVAEIASERVSDYGELIIDFKDPEVISYWPNCVSACVNSEIGAQFNTSLNEASITRAGNFIVYKCANESCRIFESEVSGTVIYNPEEKIAVFNHSGLEAENYYRVIIRGGVSGVLGSSGTLLVKTNYGEGDRDFSWIFRTRDSDLPCDISSVDLKPKNAVLSYIGQTQQYSSAALGAPDECSERGQRLQTLSYDWSWASGNISVADFMRERGILLDVLPRSGTSGCNDKCLHTGTQSGISVCGNRILEFGEDCDDGNVDVGDGCSSICLNEGSVLGGTICGNGRMERGEDCDDGNVDVGDGCSSICLNEGSVLGGSACGNGDIGDGEDCDDQNSRNGDGCSSECLNEGSLTGPLPVCGNRILEFGEDCDDGNVDVGDGCSSICLNEGKNKCESPTASNCCGNSRVENGEDCDDGNNMSGDGCSSRCLKEGSNLIYNSVCGNATASDDLETGEECEFSNPPSGDRRTDPIQYAEALFGGETLIESSVGDVSDEGTLQVACVCERDSQCIGASYPLGCGVGGCCAARPQVAAVAPTGSDICRNALISVEFNMLMDAESFEENFEVGTRPMRPPWFVGDPMLMPLEPCPVGELSNDETWCGIPGIIKTINEEDRTTLRFSPQVALNEDTTYYARIKGDLNTLDDVSEGVLSANGVGMTDGLNAEGYYVWSFETGEYICTIDEIETAPNPLYFLEVGNRSILAQAYSRIGTGRQEIARIPGVYDWRWAWRVRDTDLVGITNTDSESQTVSLAPSSPRKGKTSAYATAEITADTISRVPTVGRKIEGESEIIILICENPWPARARDGSWSPYEISGDGNNFSFYYCRDVGVEHDTSDDLPPIRVNTVPAPPIDNILSEFLVPVVCAAGSDTCASGDALGIRVMKNAAHYSPMKWYTLNGFSGRPSEIFMDNYPALQDGRTVYVNAANVPEGALNPSLFTNIYIISHVQDAGADTLEIYNQILENISFTTTISSWDDKEMLRRDVKRLADVRDIEESLINYSRLNRGKYPTLASGSFLPHFTTSKWPSWQIALGGELGFVIPEDPLNQFGICATPYNPETCYNADTQTFRCAPGSNVYFYENCLENNYNLLFNLEYAGGSWAIDRLFGADYNLTAMDCAGEVWNSASVCSIARDDSGVVSAAPASCGNGILEIEAGEVCDDGSLNGRYNHCNIICSGWGAYCGDGDASGLVNVQRAPYGNEVCDLGTLNGVYGSACSWDCRRPYGPYCGDGIISDGEVCEVGDSETSAEGCAPIGGYETQKTRNCTDCMWPDWSTVSCLAIGSCGNGLVDGDGEECDDGNTNNNDSCVNTCQSARCGDGFVRLGYEQCDLGSANGDPCFPSSGLACTYCSTSCTLLTISGD